ncbi:MAG: hypothetical protein EOO01_16240 [Chitinophagaceae bacterium]|nr:MAG: hypothetical protein EOO01_16240 [Chitinophagaceae bacterium]
MLKKILLICLFTGICAAQKTALSTSAANTAEKLYRTTDVDSKPEIKEGMYTLPLFVSQNFKLPNVHNYKVKLFIGFVVETDGSITNIRFIHQNVTPLREGSVIDEEQKKKDSALLDTMKPESVRVMTAFNKLWVPAMKDGKPVRCQYNYPMNFNLE